MRRDPLCRSLPAPPVLQPPPSPGTDLCPVPGHRACSSSPWCWGPSIPCSILPAGHVPGGDGWAARAVRLWRFVSYRSLGLW